MGGLFPIYKETGSGVMFVYAPGEMRAVCVVCVCGGAEAGDGVWVGFWMGVWIVCGLKECELLVWEMKNQ